MVSIQNLAHQSLKKPKIVVIGDLLLDKYTFGKTTRISPEAPVPVVNVSSEDFMPGGAGNVALNLHALGAEVCLIGRIGDDLSGKFLLNSLVQRNISTQQVYIQPSFITSVKNRVIADNQQITRIDFESYLPLCPALEKRIIDFLPEIFTDTDIIAVSDYNKGFLSDQLLQAVYMEAANQGIRVITDPKGRNFTKYFGTSIIKPNEAEALEFSTSSSSLTEAAEAIFSITAAQNVIITRASRGISLYNKNLDCEEFAVDAKLVKDVTGAGDTVLAVLCFSLAKQLSLPESLRLCNIAAEVVITKIGCASIDLADLIYAYSNKFLKQKIFDQHSLPLLHTISSLKPFNLLVIDALKHLQHSIFQALNKSSADQRPLFVFIKDQSPCQATLKVLSSFSEVDFIFLGGQSIDSLKFNFTPLTKFEIVDGSLSVVNAPEPFYFPASSSATLID